MAYKLPNFTVTAQIQIIERPNAEKNRLNIKMKNFEYPAGQRLKLDERVTEFKKLVDVYESEFRAHKMMRVHGDSKFKPKCFLTRCKSKLTSNF